MTKMTNRVYQTKDINKGEKTTVTSNKASKGPKITVTNNEISNIKNTMINGIKAINSEGANTNARGANKIKDTTRDHDTTIPSRSL